MRKKISLLVNNKTEVVTATPETPLLWVLRDNLELTGTKYGCGKGLCGSCTVHVDGEPKRACLLPISVIGNKKVTTIEGLSTDSSHPVQQAWLAEDVPQCGYCQAGQIMSAVALLIKESNPTEQQINEHMSGNLCRCGTYGRIKKAINRASISITEI